MANITDYIRWRGDLDFDTAPFNEVDGLVLCLISYYKMTGVMEESDRKPLRQVVQELKEGPGFSLQIVSGTGEEDRYLDALLAAADSRRFGDLMLSDYVDHFDESISKQFSAVTIELPGNRKFLAYRGTDDSIAGWKEDFMLSFTRIPAQEEALAYAERVMREALQTSGGENENAGTGEGEPIHSDGTQFYIGGHSKGANLAVYAAAELPDDLQEKVQHVYMYDGPGICETVMDTSMLGKIREKTTKIQPEYCLIGTLFEEEYPDSRIVASDEEGLNQHALISWQVAYGDFQYVQEHAPESLWLAEAMNIWVEEIPNEGRKKFIDDLFGSLGSGGATTMKEISDGGFAQIQSILMSMYGADEVSKEIARKLPVNMLFGETPKEADEKSKNLVEKVRQSLLLQGCLLALAGAFFLLLPAGSIMIIFSLAMTAVVGALVVRALLYLKKSNWNLKQNRVLVYLAVGALAIYLILMLKESALEVFSSFFFGMLFLIIAYRYGELIRAGEYRIDSRFVHVRCYVEVALLTILGLFSLFAPARTMKFYAISIGGILVLDGLSRLVEEWIRRRREKTGGKTEVPAG